MPQPWFLAVGFLPRQVVWMGFYVVRAGSGSFGCVGFIW